MATGHAWYGHEPCALRAGDANARVLRFELYRDRPPALDGGMLKLAHSIDLDPEAAWLMRCDRVDFEPAGEAPLHRHRGGGIRCLLRGAIEITVGDEPARRILPGGAWFESGREPVYAAAAPDEETSFIRVTRPAGGDPRTELHHVREPRRRDPKASLVPRLRRRAHPGCARM